ncbi:MAG: FeoB-associated Cys-rich membrane protein [Bacteroidales bacterium]|nr:FeoB-associated Cys-rich membrane protein [Bacteroidales bacterium]
MNLPSIIALIVVFLLVEAALLFLFRNRRKGNECGCYGCSGSEYGKCDSCSVCDNCRKCDEFSRNTGSTVSGKRTGDSDGEEL